MNSLILALCIVGIGLAMYCALQLDSIKTDVEFIREYVFHVYQNTPSGEWFSKTSAAVFTKLDGVEDKLTAEIACLATKNNEDIKRMGGKFEEWDLIELDGNDLLITDIEADDDGNVKVHCINNKGKGYTYYRDAPVFKNYARFIKHSSSPFDEQE